MKKLLVFIVGIIIASLSYAQFSSIEFNDIFSTDSINAWVVGSNGTIIHTTDGGGTWADHSYNTELSLNSVYFTTEQKGFIVGDSGIVLKTTDGGSVWNLIDLGVLYNFKSVSFVDDQYGWIAFNYHGLQGGEGLFRTVNGGEEWIYIDQPIYNPFFIDANNGWGATFAGGRKVKRSYDGGIIWDSISTYVGTGIPSFFFIDSSNGFMSKPWMGNTSCYNTSDGGVNWTPNNLWDEGLVIEDIFFQDALNGWVGGRHQIFYSNDSFESYETFWQYGEWYKSFSIHGFSNGWAVSFNWVDDVSSVWKLSGINNWFQLDPTGIYGREQRIIELIIYPNPASNIIHIQCQYPLEEVMIHKLSGQEVLRQTGTKEEMNVSSLVRGIYILEARMEEGVVLQKFVKQ